VVEQTRPSIADILSGNSCMSTDDEDVNDALSVPSSVCVARTQLLQTSAAAAAAATRSQCSEAASSHDQPSDSQPPRKVTGSSVSTHCDRSIYAPVSSSHSLQKPAAAAASAHSQRTVSQMFSRQSSFGSMMSSFNCSLPQLNSLDAADLFASRDRLDRTAAVARGGVDELAGRQQAGSEAASVKDDVESVTSMHVRREEEDRRIAEFTKIEASLQELLSPIEKQLNEIQSTYTTLTSSVDLETIEGLSCEFVPSDGLLSQLTAASGDVMEVTDSVEVVKAIQEKVRDVTARVTATRNQLGELRTKVQAINDTYHANKMELNQLMDWLSDASRRVGECTQRPSVNTVLAEQQLGQLLTLHHEFSARKARFQDLENCDGLDRNSVLELGHQFERTNDACRSCLERHRRLFGALTDLRNNIQQIAGWVAKTGPLYSLDSGSAIGSVDLLMDNHTELEHRLEEAAQLREKVMEFLASLRTSEGEGQAGQGQGVEVQVADESSLVLPLFECQYQLHQLRELVATRASNMVKYYYNYYYYYYYYCYCYYYYFV